jgi:transporter family-2 protein
MQTVLFVVVIGLIGGIAVGFQGPLSSLISQRLGVMESVFIIHLGGAIAALVPLLVRGGGNLSGWRSLPWYALGAGLLGLGVLSAISYTIPRLGVATTIMLVVAGQLLVGVVLDHFGLLGAAVRPLELSRLIGMVVVFVGVWLMVR